SLLSDEKDGDGCAAEEQEEGNEAPVVVPTNRPLVWRLAEVSLWPELPNLESYVSHGGWHDHAASGPQLRVLRGFGPDVARPLTKGEASHLIDRAVKLEADFPTPPTRRQEWFLRAAGCWEEGMTKREASRLIGQRKRITGVA